MMMNQRIVATFLTFVMGITAASAVLTEDLHNGEDLNAVEQTGRRYLRATPDRELQLTCKEKCKGYTSGWCHVPGCTTYGQLTVATLPPMITSETLAPGSETDLGNRNLNAEDEKERELQLTCKEKCKGYTSGWCHVPGCTTYGQLTVATLPPMITSETLAPGSETDLGNRNLNAEDEKERELQLTCKEKCKGYTSGWCHVPGCTTYGQLTVASLPPMITGTIAPTQHDGTH